MKSKKPKKGLCALLRELSDDEENTIDAPCDVSEDSDRPWLRYFQAYMDINEQVPEGWSAIKWWGVSVLSTPMLNIQTAHDSIFVD